MSLSSVFTSTILYRGKSKQIFLLYSVVDMRKVQDGTSFEGDKYYRTSTFLSLFASENLTEQQEQITRMETFSSETLSFGKSATIEEIKISVEGVPNLKSLELEYCGNIGDGALRQILPFLNPQLEKLKLSHLQDLSDEDVIILSERCRDLKEVDITFCRGVSKDGLTNLVSNCSLLQQISLHGTDSKDTAWNLTETEFEGICSQSKILSLKTINLLHFPRINATVGAHIGQTFRSLTSINLSFCSAVGDEGVGHLVTNCSELDTLVLKKTGVSDLTLHLIASKLKGLVHLNVSDCPQISDEGLQSVARHCFHLKSIDASMCLLITERSLESFAQHCHRLREIVLSETHVAKLPDAILWLSRLEKLGLENCNGLIYPPKNVISQNVDGIMEFFRVRNLSYRLRVIVLGPPESGKTSLVKCLTSDGKSPDVTTDKKEDDCKISLWFPFRDPQNEKLMNRTLEPKERALTIDIYDVPGRPVCRKCIQPFLSSTSLPVLVFNISDDKSCDAVIDDVNYMRTKLPRTPLILVGLHADRILNEETRRAKCTEIQDAIKEQTKNLIQDLEEELKTFRETTTSGKAETRLIRERIAWIEKRMEELSNEITVIIPASTVTTKGLDDVKKCMIETALNEKFYPHVRKHVNEQTTKAFHKILDLRKEKVVMESREAEKLLSVTGKTGNGNTAVINQELKFLCDVGVVQTIPFGHKSSLYSTLLCLDPPTLLHAINAIHVDNPNKAFRFEAKRFWPKNGSVGKPSPGLLVKALEEIALRGSIRESVFPLMWQDIKVEEDQVRKMIEFLKQSCYLVRESSLASSTTFDNLVSPKFPGLSSHQIYHMPFLNLMSEEGPTLNWTPEPFKGDIQLCWRYRFLPVPPPGLISAVLSFCRMNVPENWFKLHWRGGLLLKLGHVLVKLGKAAEDENCLDVTSRIPTDEDGDLKATEAMWSTTANILIIIHHFLNKQCGISFRMVLVPCPVYFSVESDDYDNWPEVPLLQCLQSLHNDERQLSLTIGRFNFTIDLKLLVPTIANEDEDVLSWLARLSSSNENLAEDVFTPAWMVNNTQEQFAESSPPLTTASQSSEIPNSPITSSNGSQQSLGKEKKMVRKKSSLKWNIADDRKFTEEEELKECKRIASGFVAVVLAEAMAKHISEQPESVNGRSQTFQQRDVCQAVAKASARAARAAQSGDAEGTVMAVVAAVQAVEGAKTKRAQPRINSAMKSKLCIML